MKALVILSLLVVGQMAEAQQSITKIISEKTAIVNVDLNSSNVKLSSADYSMPVVKVLIPDLAAQTVLDHRNSGEAAPCMATYETRDPQAVIQGKPEIVQANVLVRLTQELYADEHGKKCYVSLSETLETNIRGLKFEHLRTLELAERKLEDCK